MRYIYADYAASAPLEPKVSEAMLPWLKSGGNPSSLYTPGRNARDAVEQARAQVAELLGAKPEEIVLTASGTEADNTVLRGMAAQNGFRGRIVSTQIEHPAVLRTLEALKPLGIANTLLAPDSLGSIAPESLRESLTSDTFLVSVMTVNNEIGTIEPIRELAALTKKQGIAFHTDAVQAAGHIPLNVRETTVDFLSLSGHKLGALPGTGALYIREGMTLPPLLTGGGQERGRRSGTENVAGIVGLGVAAVLAKERMEAESRRLTALRERLTTELLKIPRSHLTGHPRMRHPGIASFCFEGVEGEALVLTLDLLGAAASSGSACSAGKSGLSPVLQAIGLSPEVAQGSLRLSIGTQTTAEDAERLIELVREAVTRLRAMSPTWEDRQ